MKKTTKIFCIVGLLILCGCENKSSKQSYTYPSNINYKVTQNRSFNNTFLKNNNTTFSNPSSYGKAQKRNNQSRSYSLEDFWDEAENVRSEAESFLGEAQIVACDEAISAAQNAISSADDCTGTRNYSEAESYLDDAQSELSNAQSYLEDCQNSRKENNDNEENEEGE